MKEIVFILSSDLRWLWHRCVCSRAPYREWGRQHLSFKKNQIKGWKDTCGYLQTHTHLHTEIWHPNQSIVFDLGHSTPVYRRWAHRCRPGTRWLQLRARVSFWRSAPSTYSSCKETKQLRLQQYIHFTALKRDYKFMSRTCSRRRPVSRRSSAQCSRSIRGSTAAHKPSDQLDPRWFCGNTAESSWSLRGLRGRFAARTASQRQDRLWDHLQGNMKKGSTNPQMITVLHTVN